MKKSILLSLCFILCGLFISCSNSSDSGDDTYKQWAGQWKIISKSGTQAYNCIYNITTTSNTMNVETATYTGTYSGNKFDGSYDYSGFKYELHLTISGDSISGVNNTPGSDFTMTGIRVK